MDKKSKFEYWKIVLCAALMTSASMGVCFYSAGAYYLPLSEQLNITLAQSSMITSFTLGFMAIGALAMPFLLKKVKLQVVLAAGSVLCGLSMLGMAFCFGIVPMYVLAAVNGIGASMIGLVPAVTMINNWFHSKKSGATSVVLASYSLAAALFSPLIAMAVTSLGWRMSFVVQTVLLAACMTPVLFLKPEIAPHLAMAQPYGQEEEAEPIPAKLPWIVLASFAVIAIASALLLALPMHFTTYATSVGQTAVLGARMLSLALVGSLVFKLAGGWLAEKFNIVVTAGLLDIAVAGAVIGFLFCTAATSQSAFLVLSFFFGSSFALNELTVPLLVSKRTSQKKFTQVYAGMNCLSMLAAAAAIPAIGSIYDSTHSYAAIFWSALVIAAVIFAILFYLLYSEKADSVVMSGVTRKLILAARKTRKEAQLRKQQQAAQKQLESQSGAAEKEEASPSVLSRQLDLVDSMDSQEAADLEKPEPEKIRAARQTLESARAQAMKEENEMPESSDPEEEIVVIDPQTGEVSEETIVEDAPETEQKS